jgi:hypothetical protein
MMEKPSLCIESTLKQCTTIFRRISKTRRNGHISIYGEHNRPDTGAVGTCPESRDCAEVVGESSNFSDPVTITGSMNPYLKSCTDPQAAMINEGWNEAATLAAAHY